MASRAMAKGKVSVYTSYLLLVSCMRTELT